MSDNNGKEVNEFYGLIEKIDRKNPDKVDILRAESLMRRYYSQISAQSLSMAGSIVKNFLDKLNPQKSQQLLMAAEASHVKEKLGYSSSNQIERLLIEQILFCWAGVNYVENHVAALLTQSGFSLNTLEYWQKTLTRYQNRYLKAIETLARVRKLNVSIQFNIATNGGKQLNVGNMPNKGK